jgi:hypothetical protein
MILINITQVAVFLSFDTHILKPIWFSVLPKTKSWLPARHIVQAGRYPRTENAEDFTRSILSQILSENYYEMSIFRSGRKIGTIIGVQSPI